MRLACNLRRFREQRGLSIRKAEAETGISRAHLSRIEHGRLLPTDSEAEAIRRVYGRPPVEWYTVDASRPLILTDEVAA